MTLGQIQVRFPDLPEGHVPAKAGQATGQVPFRDFESRRTETGCGSETSIRVPQTEQWIEPACSVTLGTVLNLRPHFGHWTSMI